MTSTFPLDGQPGTTVKVSASADTAYAVSDFPTIKTTDDNGQRASMLLITVEENSCRISFTADASQTVGHLRYAGDALQITRGGAIAKASFANAVAGSNFTLQVTPFFENPPTFAFGPGGDHMTLFASNGINLELTSDTGSKWIDIDPSLIDIQEYGVSWDEATDTYERLGDLALYPVSATPGSALLPIQAGMRCCVLNDAADDIYYLDPSNRNYKDGSGDPSNLDGTDGQVMVQVPKFYWKYDYTGTKHSWTIRTTPKDGFEVHPAFIKGGSEVDYRYMGAYEGHIDGNGKLSSISGAEPTRSKTRAQFRTAAGLRGDRWHQQDLYLYSAIQLLYLIEYADFNSQSMIGAGRTALSDGEWTLGSYIAATGLSNGDGNGTNSVSNGGSAGHLTDYMTYRGVENWFGHIWKWLDGINVHNSLSGGSRAYACQDYGDFADDTDAGYTLLGQLPEAVGYPTALIPGSLFLPRTVGGSSATYLCDYYYTHYDTAADSGWRVVFSGGGANYGVRAGAFCVHSSNASSYTLSTLGGRLCC